MWSRQSIKTRTIRSLLIILSLFTTEFLSQSSFTLNFPKDSRLKPKMKYSITLLLPLLTPLASACLTISGNANIQQFTNNLYLKAEDDGRVVCEENIRKPNGNIHCSAEGYSLWADSQTATGPLRVKYNTPHGNWDFLVDKDCDQWGCGGDKSE